MSTDSPALSAGWSTWMTASAALFFLLMLSAPSGYSVGAGGLLLGGLAIGWQIRARGALATSPHAPTAAWSREDRRLALLLLAMFLVEGTAVLLHGDRLKYLDQGSRYLLAIPILYGLRTVRLKLSWIAAGLVLGTLATAAVAAWQIHLWGISRATGFVTSAIPFGDMALSLGFWCLMTSVALFTLNRRWLAGVALVGALAGAYAAMASGTRGSLLALPVFLVLMAFALLRGRQLKRLFAGLLAIGVLAVAGLALLPQGQFAESRYAGAIAEWRDYQQQADATNNVGSRLEAWKAALISLPKRPLLGWSQAGYEGQLQQLIQEKRIDPFVATLANTHNNFIEVVLHRGVIGLLTFLALLLGSFWLFAQRLCASDGLLRILACCGASLPAAFGAYGLTQVILGRNNGVMFFLVSLAILWAALRQREHQLRSCPIQ